MVSVYTLYLLISLGLTVWVARTLSTHGRPFLVQVFHGNTELADSVNQMLVVGFYLVNTAFVCLALYDRSNVATIQDGMELLGSKVGLCITVLGVIHFLNLTVFCHLRDRVPP